MKSGYECVTETTITKTLEAGVNFILFLNFYLFHFKFGSFNFNSVINNDSIIKFIVFHEIALLYSKDVNGVYCFSRCAIIVCFDM